MNEHEERQFNMRNRLREERDYYEQFNKKNGISPKRLRELQELAQVNSFNESSVFNTARKFI